MSTSYLTYYKTILEKVSFDKQLLIKEYYKALRSLNTRERSELNNWLQSRGILNFPLVARNEFFRSTTANPQKTRLSN
ncbi:MAG: hypothetical protein WBA74_09150 [Cyclobacteriaceae bacterium]